MAFLSCPKQSNTWRGVLFYLHGRVERGEVEASGGHPPRGRPLGFTENICHTGIIKYPKKGNKIKLHHCLPYLVEGGISLSFEQIISPDVTFLTLHRVFEDIVLRESVDFALRQIFSHATNLFRTFEVVDEHRPLVQKADSRAAGML